MQTKNVNLPITVTGRHMSVTDSMRDYAHKKIEGLHLDYPKIIEAKAILDVQNRRQIAEIVLFCANHITIEADSEGDDLYAAIDETISKVARRMRKYKTRLLKSHRPRQGSIRHIPEEVFSSELFDGLPVASATPEPPAESEEADPEPYVIHPESFKIRPLYPDEAIMDLELNERSFVVFQNPKNEKLSIVYRRPDGDYGMIVPEA